MYNPLSKNFFYKVDSDFYNSLATDNNNHIKLLALSLLKEYGLPSNKSEEWHFHQFNDILYNQKFTTQKSINKTNDLQIFKSYTDKIEAGYKIYFFDNQPILIDPNLPQSIQISLQENLLQNLKITNPNLDNLEIISAFNHQNQANPQHGLIKPDSILWLNTYNCSLQIKITITEDTSLPIQIILLNNDNNSLSRRIAIECKENTKSQIEIYNFFNQNDDLHSLNTNLITSTINEGATLNFSNFFINSAKNINFNSDSFELFNKSTLKYQKLQLGGIFNHNDLYINFNEPFSTANAIIRNLASPNGQSHQFNICKHNSHNCHSLQNHKSISQENSISSFNGKIIIPTTGKLSDGYMQTNNLTTHLDSKVYNKPLLEIYNHNVKCSHGSTISTFNQNQIQYLQSRGISESNAKQELAKAFLLADSYLPWFIKQKLDQYLKL